MQKMVATAEHEHETYERNRDAPDAMNPAEVPARGVGGPAHEINPAATERHAERGEKNDRQHDKPRRRGNRVEPLPAVQYGEFDGTESLHTVHDRAEPAGARIDVGAQAVGAVEFDAPHRQQAIDARILPVEGFDPSGVANARRGLADELTRKILGILPVAIGKGRSIGDSEIAPLRRAGGGNLIVTLARPSDDAQVVYFGDAIVGEHSARRHRAGERRHALIERKFRWFRLHASHDRMQDSGQTRQHNSHCCRESQSPVPFEQHRQGS